MEKEFIVERKEVPITNQVDVLVAGGGPAGIGAALAAARLGAKVMIVEQLGALGGVATTGLHPRMDMLVDAGRTQSVVAGIAKEICDRLIKLKAADPIGHNGNLNFDPEIMKLELDQMMLDSGVNILYHTMVVGSFVEDNIMRGIIVENKAGRSVIKAKVTIDCTADADAAARAGAPFEKGRESDGLMQPVTLMFRLRGVDFSQIKEYMNNQDARLKKLCQRAIKAGDMPPFQTKLMGFERFSGRPDELFVNFTNMTGIDPTSAVDLTRAEIEGRRQVQILVRVFHKYLPGCENAYLVETANMIGTRESRRILGEYTLTVDDVLGMKKFKDGIAKSAFFVDIHNPTGTGMASELDLPHQKGACYDIPYRCLIPRKVENLLVAGRCISVTHEALGSTRVMFQCMAIGQAAGTAAGLCIEKKVLPRDLDVPLLRSTLIRYGAIV